jgi:hypothetical protein
MLIPKRGPVPLRWISRISVEHTVILKRYDLASSSQTRFSTAIRIRETVLVSEFAKRFRLGQFEEKRL